MLRNRLDFATSILSRTSFLSLSRSVITLSPGKITELLTKNEKRIAKDVLPNYLQSIECNQLASNSPIEDRMRISSLTLPGVHEPTLILGVFDGHGGGTTADLISRRLFNYIAISLYPEPEKLMISNHEQLKNLLVDIHNSPTPKEDPSLQAVELDSLSYYKKEISSNSNDIAAKLKASFKRCDDDLSTEIQQNLTNSRISQSTLHYYLSAAVSGCCALVMVIHKGIGYIASTGDCRGVLGIHNKDHVQGDFRDGPVIKNTHQNYGFSAIDLNDEHNCDNINEIKRLAASHPKSEQNSMIRYNRLLGQLMPFRAFGDFNYKWSADLIKECGITRAFGSGVIPSNYNTPPYLIAEPDIKEMELGNLASCTNDLGQKYIVIASDGLWELFESSRDVIGTLVNHSLNAGQEANKDDYDKNCATHILRSALRSGSYQDSSVDIEELRRLYHIRLESTLTLSPAVVRNFRDDISIIILKMNEEQNLGIKLNK